MKKLGWWGSLFLMLLAGAFGCGFEDEPIPSPHAIAIVTPQSSDQTPYLFASNRFLHKVYRINLETLDVDEISVGKKPRNIAASPDGSLVAVANERGKSITVIDSITLAKTTVQTGYCPRDVQFSPDGNWIGVANLEGETVSLINAHSGNMWNIWVGGGPNSVAFDPTSRFLAAACYNEDAVKIINVETKKYYYNWMDQGAITRPQAVTFSKQYDDGSYLLFVGCHEDPYEYHHESYADSIVVLHWQGDWYENESYQPTTTVVRAGPNPRGFLWNYERDRLFAVNHVFGESEYGYTIDTVSVLKVEYNREPNVREDFRFVTEENPVAATITPSGMLAVANKNGGSISLLDTNTYSSRNYGTLAKPYALAFNPSGNKVIVVHETPLMPLSVVNLQTGKVKVVFDSLSMGRWIE